MLGRADMIICLRECHIFPKPCQSALSHVVISMVVNSFVDDTGVGPLDIDMSLDYDTNISCSRVFITINGQYF